jgi:hypothetical protein
LVYSSTLRIKMICSSDFQQTNGVLFQKIELFKPIAVRTSNPTYKVKELKDGNEEEEEDNEYGGELVSASLLFSKSSRGYNVSVLFICVSKGCGNV